MHCTAELLISKILGSLPYLWLFGAEWIDGAFGRGSLGLRVLILLTLSPLLPEPPNWLICCWNAADEVEDELDSGWDVEASWFWECSGEVLDPSSPSLGVITPLSRLCLSGDPWRMPGVDELTFWWWPGGRAVFATEERLFVGCCSTPDGPPRCKFFSSSSNVDNSICSLRRRWSCKTIVHRFK